LFSNDKDGYEVVESERGGRQDLVAEILKGLSLSPWAEEQMKKSANPKKLERLMKRNKEVIWDVENAHKDTEFDYFIDDNDGPKADKP